MSPKNEACASHSSREVFRANGEAADALSGRLENRVADGRRNPRRAGLAGAAGSVLARHDMHFHHRHLIDAQYVVLMEITLLYASAVDRDATLERRRQTERDAALNLLLQNCGVHDAPAIHRAHDAMHLQLAAGDRYFRHLSREGADVIRRWLV